MASSSSGPRYLAGWIALKLNYEVGIRAFWQFVQGDRMESKKGLSISSRENKRREQLSTGGERERKGATRHAA